MILLHLESRSATEKTDRSAFWESPFGTLELFGSSHGLHVSRFIDKRIGSRVPLPAPWGPDNATLSLRPGGTRFQHSVWQALMRIEAGQTMSYKALAIRLGKPQATRAVANALAANPLPGFIPCHRVIRSNNTLGGYSQGVALKQALLNAEKKGHSINVLF